MDRDELIKIALDSKLVIFDFDDTLALHLNKNYRKNRKDEEYFRLAYLNPEIFYEEIECCKPSEILQRIVKECKKHKIKMYCISGMRFSLHQNAKEYFIKTHYDGDIEFVIARNQETKKEVIEILKNVYDCEYEDILFFDDMSENIEMMASLGIKAFDMYDIS